MELKIIVKKAQFIFILIAIFGVDNKLLSGYNIIIKIFRRVGYERYWGKVKDSAEKHYDVSGKIRQGYRLVSVGDQQIRERPVRAAL